MAVRASRAGRPGAGAGDECVVTELTLEALSELWRAPDAGLEWDCLFVLPPWLGAWRATLGADESPLLYAVWRGERPLGIAPLRVRGDTAWFLGSPDVCDYGDFILAPAGPGAEGADEAFFRSLLAHLESSGVRRLDLGPVRPGSAVRTRLPPVAGAAGWAVSWAPEGVAVELDLPRSWEEFLDGLGKKERHEVRRKLRRLEAAGAVRLRRTEPGAVVEDEGGRFLELFAGYRADKASFLEGGRLAFFRQLLAATAREGLLNLSFLEVGEKTVAGVLCFEHRGTTHLYNNGYDPRWEGFSVGTVSKVWSIRDSIARGLSRYDFLKGDEAYKRRLGGRAVPLARCRLSLP